MTRYGWSTPQARCYMSFSNGDFRVVYVEGAHCLSDAAMMLSLQLAGSEVRCIRLTGESMSVGQDAWEWFAERTSVSFSR